MEYLIQTPVGGNVPAEFSQDQARKAQNFHRQLPAYNPTDLVGLSDLAKAWGVKEIFIKDESTRFGLKAFKVLGGSYAVAHLICQRLGISLEETDFNHLVSNAVHEQLGQITLATATDGNHGRGIAWTAEKFRQKAMVYMPKNPAAARVENIRAHGAEVEVTDLNYDDAVRYTNRKSEENGWYMIQDTAWEGYTDVPLKIMQGYMTMCVEAVNQMEQQGTRPTHVFVQAGVGALAGAIVGYLANVYMAQPPKFIIMEPTHAACIFASAAAGDGRPHAVGGDLATIMAGLSCGEPNTISWPILRDFPCCYVKCDNFMAANGMRILAAPTGNDAPVESGESGALGIGLMEVLTTSQQLAELKQTLEIGPDSTVLFFNTEGATDPENYREVVWHGKYPSLK